MRQAVLDKREEEGRGVVQDRALKSLCPSVQVSKYFESDIS